VSNHEIAAEKITKPIQLLAAWLTGLLAIDTCFLVAASRFPDSSWQSGALTGAAIANVFIFLAAVFLLQTRFRPELQEDVYYSTYINQKTSAKIHIPREEAGHAQLLQRMEKLEASVLGAISRPAAAVEESLLRNLRFGVNLHLKNIEEISRLLGEVGVAGYSTFGTDELPQEHVFSVSRHLPDDIARHVIDLGKRCGFRSYNFFDNHMEDTPEDVLFGSYGDGDFKIADAAATDFGSLAGEPSGGLRSRNPRPHD
jgi:hypothetical protein